MSDLKPMQLGRVKPLLSSESVDPSVSSEDYDWDAGGYAGEASVNDQWKQPCRVATTASITISTALNNGDTLDGVTLATGDRVLVKDQGTPAQNGIYIVGATPERAADFDDDDEVLGALVYVIAGTANTATAWKVTNTTAVTVGSTSIVWAAFGSGGSTSFGTPANTYGTPAAGAASTAIRTDAVLPGPNIVVLTLTNKSGGSVAAGDVVVVDTSNNEAFTTTTTGQAEVSVGVAQATIANNAAGAVLVSGYAALVNVPASVTRGHYVETHTVVKQATGSSTRRAGSFGQFLTGGTTPTAWLWGQTDQTASGSGSVATDAIWDNAGDLALGTGANTASKLAIGANTYVLTSNGTTASWAAPSSGGTSWTQDVSVSGTSFTGWVAASGTWSSNGTEIIQTDTTATQRRARYDTKIPIGFGVIVEVEANIVSGSSWRAGILVSDMTSAGPPVFYMQSGAVILEWDASSARLSFSTTINTGTWYKLRMVLATGLVSCYIDGVLAGSTGNTTGAAGQNYVGLYTYNGSIKFRNFKAWTLSGGAPA